MIAIPNGWFVALFYPHYCKSHEKSLVVFEHHDLLGTALATDSCVFCQKKAMSPEFASHVGYIPIFYMS
jgi:hypothetical protein